VLVPRTYDGTLFRTRPVVRAEVAYAGEGNEHGGKRMLVVAVGVEGFTAVRLKDDRTVTVAIDMKTDLQDGKGHACEVDTFLSTLSEGDLVRVRGKRDKAEGLVRARRIVRVEPEAL
jgi:hypothetical protein